jgi:hypothetical protein
MARSTRFPDLSPDEYNLLVRPAGCEEVVEQVLTPGVHAVVSHPPHYVIVCGVAVAGLNRPARLSS